MIPEPLLTLLSVAAVLIIVGGVVGGWLVLIRQIAEAVKEMRDE